MKEDSGEEMRVLKDTVVVERGGWSLVLVCLLAGVYFLGSVLCVLHFHFAAFILHEVQSFTTYP